VRAQQDADGGLCLSVRDNGVGIDAADLPRVMQPFEQVGESYDTHNRGVGLGLPLARHLIELHGGSLELHSSPGSGTTAVIVLPASRVLIRKDGPD